MTSGEWDLRALKALEEEELKQFQLISEPDKIKIPPPPTPKKLLLPTINEFCGESLTGSGGSDEGGDSSLQSSPILTLPTGLTSKLLSSAAILSSPPPSSKRLSKTPSCCTSLGGGGSVGGGGGGSSSSSGSSSRRKYPKNHNNYHHHQQQQQQQQHQQRHQFPCKSLLNCSSSNSGSSRASSCSTTIVGGGGGVGVSGNISPASANIIASEVVAIPPSTIESNDMMTMMMFLSSTAPPEVSSPATVTSVGGTASSFLCTSNIKSTSDGSDDGSGGGNCAGTYRINNKKSTSSGSSGGCKNAHSGSAKSAAAAATAKSDVIDYELEDHIKHCSCSCNHMGYGNSMDYQTTGFGGLPDVTEHSNIRRTASRQDSVSNSESADVSSLSKSTTATTTAATTKKPIKAKSGKRKYCIFSLSVIFTLILCGIASILVYQFYLTAPSRDSHDERLKIVHKILKEVPLIDGHNDLAWNVRKYAHGSLELLDLSHELDHKSIWHRPQWSQTDIPRLKQGLVGAQFWSAYVPCEAQGLDAVQLALEQIDIIHRFTELHPKETTLVVSSQEILTAHRKGLLASLIGIEGGHALGSSLGVLRSMHSLGARYLTLTHQCDTSWAGSSNSMSIDKGLSSFGKAVIKEMNRLGMLIDLSHSSDATSRDVLDVTRAPVIFSHSGARSLCNSSRNIPDDIIRAVTDNGGLIMISFDSEYISCSDSSTLHDVVNHIKYIRSIAGIQHIGIGAGYDGIDNPPLGLDDVSKYPNLFATLLEDTNWSEDDIAMLAGKNFLRVLKSVENVRDYWKRAAIPPVETAEPIKKSQCTYMSS